jgi:hypothetical protein
MRRRTAAPAPCCPYRSDRHEVRTKTTVFDKAREAAKDRLFARGRYAA